MTHDEVGFSYNDQVFPSRQRFIENKTAGRTLVNFASTLQIAQTVRKPYIVVHFGTREQQSRPSTRKVIPNNYSK